MVIIINREGGVPNQPVENLAVRQWKETDEQEYHDLTA